MRTRQIPSYEWRYLPKPEWVEGPSAHVYGLTSALALMLITKREDHLVLHLTNPRPGVSPVAQPSFELETLNGLLRSAISEHGGVIKALAAQTLFSQHVKLATAASLAGPFDLEPPGYAMPVLRDLLAPSLGWLIWNWQLETLLRSAGCTAALSRELVRCWRLNYPRSAQILDSLSIGKHSLRTVVEQSTPCGGILENMTISPALMDCFS